MIRDPFQNSKELGLLCQSPGLGRSPGEGKGYPLPCSGLENPRTITPGVAESDPTK